MFPFPFTIKMKWLHLMLYFLVSMQTTHSVNNSSEVAERYRRHLIYPGGGLVKIILGFSAPVVLSGKRSLGCAYNLQGQFRVPTEVRWVPTTLEGISRKVRHDDTPEAAAMVDESRQLVYNMLERLKNWSGKNNGRDCLLRTVCEVTQSPLSGHNGIFGELIDTIFIPAAASKVEDYIHDAQMAGLSGVNCWDLYRKCPLGDGFLDSFLF